MSAQSPLLVDLYGLTMAQAYQTYRQTTKATFDLFVRQLPKNRSYLVAAGLADIISYITNLRFARSDIAYLRSLGLFSNELLAYLARFKFTGDVWAMPEGTIFFPPEPVIRVTAPIIQAQIIESFLLNTVNLQAMITSKASRVVQAAGDRRVFDFSFRRTHGQDAGVKVARCAYLAGCAGTSTVLAGKLYHIPVVGTMAHSFVMSFKHELDAFLAYAETFPGRTILLVDTYDSRKGIGHALTIALYLKERGYRLQGIRLDSGNIGALSRLARRTFDTAGLGRVSIVASGNLDEYKIHNLLKARAPVDSFGVGTNMGTSIDAPCLDVIYKISEITDEDGKFLPTMKLSHGKVTFPGRKQVFRVRDARGRFVRDVLGLESETRAGQRLLRKVIDRGRVVYRIPSLEASRAYVKKNLKQFPQAMLDIHSTYAYPVVISKKLASLRRGLARQLAMRQ